MQDALNTPDLEYLAEYGGVALGLSLLDRLSRVRSDLALPPWVAIPIDLVRDGGPALTKVIEPYFGQDLFLKLSGVAEAFSDASTRGANSSVLRPRLSFRPGDPVRPALLRSAPDALAEDVAAVVLQRAVPSSKGAPCITHTCNDKVITELVNQGVRYLFEVEGGRIVYSESSASTSSADASKDRLPLRVADLHLWIADSVGFDVNTEGFVDAGTFTAIQLRPVPDDAPFDPELAERLAVLRDRLGSHVTRFVWGAFDYRGPIAAHEARGVSPPGALAFTESYRLSQVDAERAATKVASPGQDVAAIAEALSPASGMHAAWAHPAVLAGVEVGRTPIVVDQRTGFNLAHDLPLLPPSGPTREHLKQIGLPSYACSTLTVGEWWLVSNGREGGICPLTS